MLIDAFIPHGLAADCVVLGWRVQIGDPIKRDETMVEVSFFELDVELPSPATGTVAELLVDEGDTATVGQVIARIRTEDSGTAGVREPRRPRPSDDVDEASGSA